MHWPTLGMRSRSSIILPIYLPTSLLTASCDIILKAPEVGDYAKLRKEILDVYTPSPSVRLTTLLEVEFVPGTCPSLFFRSLKSQVTDLNLTDDFLLTRWISKLPEAVRPALLVLKQQGSPLHIILAAADDAINSVSSGPRIAALKTNTRPIQKRQPFRRFGFFRNQRQKRRSRLNRPVNAINTGTCWFHRRFGSRAKHCKTPCQFKAENKRQ